MAGGRLDLDKAIEADLRGVAAGALGEVRERSPKTYDPSAYQEADEVFLMTRSMLPPPPVLQRPRRQPEGVTDLLALVGTAPGLLPIIAPSDLKGRTFHFYAVVVTEKGEEPIAFVKRQTAGRVVGQGRIAAVLGQTVTKLESPVMIFSEDFDLIVDGDEIAVLRTDAVNSLFVDLDVVAAAAPQLALDLQETVDFIDDDIREAVASICRVRGGWHTACRYSCNARTSRT